MEKIYDMVKTWYEDGCIDHENWRDFCVACLEMLMEENQDVLKRLKNM